jgi:hypothetical protein
MGRGTKTALRFPWGRDVLYLMRIGSEGQGPNSDCVMFELRITSADLAESARMRVWSVETAIGYSWKERLGFCNGQFANI